MPKNCSATSRGKELELVLRLPIIVRQLCFVEMVKYTRTHLSSCSSRMIKILKAQGLIGCGQLEIFIFWRIK